MIKIRAINIVVNTTSGLFGANYSFNSGLNIIRGDNTSGKSSLFQAIIYSLGFEELIGSRNEKTMQSVLKDVVEYPKDREHQVIQSHVELEFENTQGKALTVKRSIIDPVRSPILIDVYLGAVLTSDLSNIPFKPMYIHDKGGASDNIYGFHSYLEKFLNWNLPIVLNKSGQNKKIYLQQIASAFIIEQKVGWSDFLATMPHYGLSNKEARVIEFLLKLDVYKIKHLKQELNLEKKAIESEWKTLYKEFKRFAAKGGGYLSELDDKPSIINDTSRISIFLTFEEEQYTILEYIEKQEELLEKQEKTKTGKVSDNIVKNEKQLGKLNQEINAIALSFDKLSEDLAFDKNKLGNYQEQQKSLEEDLRKNKGAQKVKKLGSNLDSFSAKNICPTCEQPVKDSLLPFDISENPMLIEDNIAFIEAQIQMIKVHIANTYSKIQEKELIKKKLNIMLSEKRKTIRNLKKELTSDERLPSEVEIEHKLNIKKRIKFYSSYLEDFHELTDEVALLSKRYEQLLIDEKNLPDDYFSENDNAKLKKLGKEFRRLVKLFGYRSKSDKYIAISKDNYLPVTQQQFGSGSSYNLKFDSSASDFIRCIWAYTCSLYLTSLKFGGNHPKLLMFDEPKQQDISMDHFRTFLSELSTYKNAQTILFASFEESDEAYAQATKGLAPRDFKLNYIKKRLIKPINKNIL